MTTDNVQRTVNTQPQDVVEIDLGEVFGILLHWLWLIVLVGLVCGASGYLFSRFVLPEEFESTTKIYVLDKSSNNNNSSNTYSDLQVGSQLTKDYAELITSRTVLETVIQDLGLNYRYEDFVKKVDVTTPTDTRIVAITVTDTDPEMAQKMADDIRKVASNHITKVMAIDAVNVVEEANFPDEKSAPSCGKWAAVSALIGVLIVCAGLVIRYVTDDTIKTSDDVQRYLDLSTLALIPLDNSTVEDIGSRKFMKKAKKKKQKGGSVKTPALDNAYEETPDAHTHSMNAGKHPQKTTAQTDRRKAETLPPKPDQTEEKKAIENDETFDISAQIFDILDDDNNISNIQ
jgi:capsular polysaccharide biosynthesis protein